MIPASTPKWHRSKVESRANAELKKRYGNEERSPVQLLIVRGYYRDSMGVKGKNDRGIYDDAFFLLADDGEFLGFNGNADPAKVRKGKGTGSEKGMGSLKPGVWKYKPGKHKGKTSAFRQAERVTLLRDCEKDTPGAIKIGGAYFYEDSSLADFGVNVHPGGEKSTNSEACLTVPPKQWSLFHDMLHALLKKYGAKDFELILIEENG